MGKNKGKKGNQIFNNNNNNKPQIQTLNNKQQQRTSVLKVLPTEELSTEEKEKYRQEGIELKQQLISEGEAKKIELIEEGNTKRDEIIVKANNEAEEIIKNTEDDKEKAIKRAIRETELEQQKIINNAKVDADEIIKEAQENARLEFQKAQEEIEIKLAAYTKESLKLEEKMKSFLSDSIKLETEKANYKNVVLSEFNSELNVLKNENQELTNKNIELKNSLNKQIKINEALEEYKLSLEEELEENSVKKQELLILQMKIEEKQANYDTLSKLYEECKEKLKEKQEFIMRFGDDPMKALLENERLTKQILDLQNQTANCPSLTELEMLREHNKKYEELKVQYDILNAEKIDFESKYNDAKLRKDDIENYRRFIKVLELQKSELQRELDHIIHLYNNHSEKIFASLSKIDIEHTPNQYGPCRVSLKDICTNFRGYLANRDKNPLYYSEQIIRTFIAGFASSRIMILEGLSGTGKSSLPRAFKDFIGCETITVPVQSSWKDRNDLLGFYNDFKKQYKETEFLKALYQASHDPDNVYCIVLDEMNLSRIEYYFADLLSILEKDNETEWLLELISDNVRGEMPNLIRDGKLRICNNTWFIGTANKDDSTFIITDKVYDRSVVLDFQVKGEYDQKNKTYYKPIQMSNSEFQKLLTNSVNFINTDMEKEFKNTITFLDVYIRDSFDITFGNRIENQLEKFVPAYVACGGTVLEAIDIMFSKKVLRKLQGMYDESTKEYLGLFLDDINKKYPSSTDLEQTKTTIKKLMEKF